MRAAVRARLGPRAAGLIRDGQEGAPVIGLAVIQRLGDGGVRGPQRRQVIGDPAGAAAAKGLEPAKERVAADPVRCGKQSRGAEGGGPG